MSDNWLYQIKHVSPGEPVDAGVVSRPDRGLEDRTQYLRDRLDASALGRATFDTNATVAPDVLPGHAVYWNYTNQQYERALAAVTVDPTTQAYVMLPSCDCVGMCFAKLNATKADIVLHGIVVLPEIVNSIGESLLPGRYYLSATEPGKLVQQRPGVTVSVCYVQGQVDACHPEPRVVVMPNPREFVDEHTHYRFELVPRPAGTNTVTTVDTIDRHTVTSPNVSTQGWLPADHESFNNKAPAGAVFGYNLSAHTALSRVWPPVPTQAVSVLWDKGEDRVGATDVPMGVKGLVICDLNGIWWMSDCYGDVPWPADFTTEPTDDNTLSPVECPRYEQMRVSIVFMRMLMGNDRRLVSSLVPALDSPITVENCDGQEANTGDLNLNLRLLYTPANDIASATGPQDDLAVADYLPTDANGNAAVYPAGLVVKGVDVSRNKLQRGWVAEGLVAHNVPQVTLTGTRNRALTTKEKTNLGLPTGDNVTLHKGIVKVTFDVLGDKEISPQIIRLKDTVERLFMDIPYLGFPEGQASLMRIRLNVPDTDLGSNVQLTVRVQFFGKGSIGQTIPALYMSYRVISRPGTTIGTALSLPTSDTALTFDSEVNLPANTAITRDSSAIPVSSGDTVLVTIGRTLGDGYPEVGILRISGVLSPVV